MVRMPAVCRCVVGEAGVAAGLFGVDAVALVAGQLADGDRVGFGSTLDAPSPAAVRL